MSACLRHGCVSQCSRMDLSSAAIDAFNAQDLNWLTGRALDFLALEVQCLQAFCTCHRLLVVHDCGDHSTGIAGTSQVV